MPKVTSTQLPTICFVLSFVLMLGNGQYPYYPQYPGAYPQQTSMCESMNYRELPMEVQNEHQCLILEQLQTTIRDENTRRHKQITEMFNRLTKLDTRLNQVLSRRPTKKKQKTGGFPALRDIPVARDCNELHRAGVEKSGVYPIQLPNGEVLNVQCDMDTDGGGWTLVQQRAGGVVNFTRKWDDYAFGFGNVNTEYWLGNENIHSMTVAKKYSLRVDMWDWEESHAYAHYEFFQVESEKLKYQLTVEGYVNSTAGDSLVHHNKMNFTTIDKDNDKWWANCARKDQSGWWFNQCSYCSLNGVYHEHGGQDLTPDGTTTGITWYEWTKKPGYSLKRVQMKLKPFVAVQTLRELNQTDAVFN